MPDRFDLIVNGAGPGGYVAAIRAAQLGMQVACIDKGPSLGGTCLNIGCIPSKALLDSSELYALAKSRFDRHGIKVKDVGLDLAKMMERKNRVVKGLTDGVAFLFKKNKITSVQGTARLAGAKRVIVQKSDKEWTTLEANAILLATGSEPAALSHLPFNGTTIVSSTEALTFDTVPGQLIVIGAGYIGLEMGSVWSRLGSKVTVLEFLPRIVPTMDAEIAVLLHKILEKQGLKFHLETKVTRATARGTQVVVEAEAKSKAVNFEADRVLVAVGRRPLTGGLGLEELGIIKDAKTGQVMVDEDYQTNVKGVYAIGDLIAGPMLAHKAQDEGVAFAERLAGQKAHVNYDAIPGVVYTWPEVASVGLTEEQAKERGQEYRIGKFPFAANVRARCLDETDGWVKIIADARTDRVLGVHILGPRASYLIAEAAEVIEVSRSSDAIAAIFHPPPTLLQAVTDAAFVTDH